MRRILLSTGLAAALTALAGAAVAAAETARAGAFSGLLGHVVSGAVEIVQTGSGHEVRLGADFSFDGAPDARVGFGRSGKFVEATDFEPLRANGGAQVYSVPKGLDPADYDEVYIWCRQYAVPLGVAPLD